MRILVKEVIISKMAGAIDRMVKSATIFIAGTTEEGSLDCAKLILREGIPESAQKALPFTRRNPAKRENPASRTRGRVVGFIFRFRMVSF